MEKNMAGLKLTPKRLSKIQKVLWNVTKVAVAGWTQQNVYSKKSKILNVAEIYFDKKTFDGIVNTVGYYPGLIRHSIGVLVEYQDGEREWLDGEDWKIERETIRN